MIVGSKPWRIQRNALVTAKTVMECLVACSDSKKIPGTRLGVVAGQEKIAASLVTQPHCRHLGAAGFKRLANEFVAKVPEGEFSPAEIQSFLLENRHSASEAVRDVEQWMNRVREERTKVKRADS